MSSCSAGIGVGDQGVDALDEAAMTGDFGSPSPCLGVSEKRLGVDALEAQDRQEGLLGTEVRAVLADVRVGARSLGEAGQAVGAGEGGPDPRGAAAVRRA